MKRLHILILMIGLGACQTKNKLNRVDYQSYLGFASYEKTVTLAEKEAEFWQKKIDQAPNQPPYYAQLAAAQTTLFGLKADATYLNAAVANQEKVNQLLGYKHSGSLRAMAHTYISMHRFKDALACLEKADALGAGKTITKQMLFDVHMELGQYEKAARYIAETKDKNSFDFLIRNAKWLDHQGDMNKAIGQMEKAKYAAESQKNEGLMVWVYTNLADFYGHDGQIEKAYRHYLQALEIDANNTYALKGIAWIAFSYHKNIAEALEIVRAIQQVHPSPDYLLMSAEMAEYMGDNKTAENLKTRFMAETSQPKYGEMYNVYQIDLLPAEKAISLAKKEVANRPTPLSYGMLSKALYASGQKAEALKVVNVHVANRSFEPDALMAQALIKKAHGQNIEDLKKSLTESAFEIGPVALRAVEQM